MGFCTLATWSRNISAKAVTTRTNRLNSAAADIAETNRDTIKDRTKGPAKYTMILQGKWLRKRSASRRRTKISMKMVLAAKVHSGAAHGMAPGRASSRQFK